MRRFDLDDVGALVGKHHGRNRTRDHRRQIEYPHSVKRSRHFLTPQI
jgi:hypothetical protein